MDFFRIFYLVYTYSESALLMSVIGTATEGSEITLPLNVNYLSVLLISVGLFLVVHILLSVGLYSIAKKNGLPNRWMSYLPFFNTYYAGVIAKKSSFFGKTVKGKTLGLIAALAEVLCAVAYFLYFGCLFLLRDCTEIYVSGSQYGIQFNFDPVLAPDLKAAYNVLYYTQYAFECLWWVYLIANLLTLMGFFRRFHARNFFMFSFLSAMFPLRGAFVYACRNNREMDYEEYLARQRQAARQWQMHQQQMMNGQNPYGNPYNNPYANGNARQNSDPFEEYKQQSGTQNTDPFGNYGEKPTDVDPFDEFNPKN